MISFLIFSFCDLKYLLSTFFRIPFHFFPLLFHFFTFFVFLELRSCQELNTKLVWKALSPSTPLQMDDVMKTTRMKHDHLGLNKLGDYKTETEIRLGDHDRELKRDGEERLEAAFLNNNTRITQEKRESITSEDGRQNDLFGLAEYTDSNEKFLSSMEGSSELDEPFHKLEECVKYPIYSLMLYFSYCNRYY